MTVTRTATITVFPTVADMDAYVGQMGDYGYCQDVDLTFKYGNSTPKWMPASRTIPFKSSVVFNCTATGSTLVMTLPQVGAGRYFYPTGVILRLVNRTGTALVQPVITVGTTAGGSDIATNSLLTGILAALSIGSGGPQVAAFSPQLSPGQMIYANVTTAATGTTAYTAKLDLVGFYDVA